MITTDSTIMIVWFTPSRIEGFAQRKLHLAQQLPLVGPKRFARFHDVSGHLRIPRFVSRIATGSA